MSIISFISKRLMQTIPVLLAVSLIAFSLIHLVPGDPARLMLGARATDEAVLQLQKQMGLDRSLVDQYWNFLKNAVRLEFGSSLFLRTAVGPLIVDRAKNTGLLVGYAILMALIITIPLAIISARQQNRVPDHSIRLFTTITFAMPNFWTALILVLIFSIRLGWFPTSGFERSLTGVLKGMTLPSIAIALYLAPILLRTLRASLIEGFGSDYAVAARARGIAEARVTYYHVLRNSLIAMVTLLGVNVGFLISGAVVIENVFSIPGLGSLMVTSIVARDYPVIVALTLIFGTIVIFANLLVDISYAVLDPRIRI